MARSSFPPARDFADANQLISEKMSFDVFNQAGSLDTKLS
jgi:hypothetical protein